VTYAAARQKQGASPLLDEIAASPPVVDPSRLREGGSDIQALAATRVRDVDAKASPDEAPAEVL
jgi:hypothetical protein